MEIKESSVKHDKNIKDIESWFSTNGVRLSQDVLEKTLTTKSKKNI